MSAETGGPAGWLRLALCTLLAAPFAAAGAEEEDPLPGLEFLEYLGSWEETDEDWVLLADVAEPGDEDEADDEESVPAPDGEKLAEHDDEE